LKIRFVRGPSQISSEKSIVPEVAREKQAREKPEEGGKGKRVKGKGGKGKG
jgi:hypothetical protein